MFLHAAEILQGSFLSHVYMQILAAADSLMQQVSHWGHGAGKNEQYRKQFLQGSALSHRLL